MRLCNRKNKLGQDAPVGSLCGLLWLIFKSLVRIFRALMRLPSPRAATSLRRTALDGHRRRLCLRLRRYLHRSVKSQPLLDVNPGTLTTLSKW